MQIKVNQLFLLTSLIALLSACSGNSYTHTRGFYYWKSGGVTEFEEHIFKESDASKLYVKLFEVTLDEVEGIIPVDKIYADFSEDFLGKTEVVPCVFIENDVIARSENKELEELVENILFLVDKYINDKLKEKKTAEITWKEIQIDCDWMKSSKDKYFQFLSYLKEKTDKRLSCTLRLYPYKFQEEMGIPPVDRAMLLCYNLLNPQTNPDKNSILDIQELKKYINGAKKYPLPLDVGLPIYSSCYKFVNGQFDEVEHDVPDGLEGACLPSEDGLWFTVEKDTSIHYNYYRKGQKLKIERVPKKLLIEASTFIRDKVELESSSTIAIYHLDQSELKNYTHETLDSVFFLFDQR